MRVVVVALACLLLLAAGTYAGEPRRVDRIDDVQQDLDSIMEDVEDLREPVQEFELFEECMYLIGVSQHGGRRGAGYVYARGRRRARRAALAFAIRGFGSAQLQLLAFPAEEPPSIECNEDAGEEDTDD